MSHGFLPVNARLTRKLLLLTAGTIVITQAPVMGAYFVNWAVYRSPRAPWCRATTAADVPPFDVTHVFYAFFRPNSITNLTLDTTDRWGWSDRSRCVYPLAARTLLLWLGI